MSEADILPGTTVRSQLIPLEDMRLLLPTTCVAEIIDWQVPEPVDDAPVWWLGMLEWRGLRIPLLSFEAANGRSRGEISRRGRIAVLNGIGGDHELPFYALQLQGIPHLTLVDQASIDTITEAEESLPLVLEYATLQEQAVLIPDQDKLEALLKSAGATVSKLDEPSPD
ncbi:MAG TPA: chemotaxis protein CheW [Chromatiales bacterium]|nr:chemotaxis protein CheW [Chromatiales bacterium]HEX22862.1 chemotaxis protein CheW [Chromatiales bacterium]